MLLPALALLSGAAIESVTQKLPAGLIRGAPLLGFAALCVLTLLPQWRFLERISPDAASRSIYGFNPFPEALTIADYIKANSAPNSTVAVFGSEPEIYFYSGRHSATGYIYAYGLMEAQPYALHMQHQMASEVEAAKPEFVVLASISTSWLQNPRSDRFIFDWGEQYLQAHYDLVGVADLLPGQTEYRWGPEAKNYRRRSVFGVEVFKRTG
jgi:hypothetical protein